MNNIKKNNHKIIAKNSIILSVRLIISTFIGLYTSRIVLQVLGAEDFGIYGVVGGVVSMMMFFNAAMSGAISRFFAFELGQKDANKNRIRDTFASMLNIQIIVAILFLFLAETVGLYFVATKLVIPEERLFAAHIVYQCSILSACLTITQIPYNAAIIAHEDMDVFAYIELANVFMKLAVAYILIIGDFDKLALYAVLLLIISIITVTTYRLYCTSHYEETKYHWIWNKDILKPIVTYSGWNLIDNFGITFRNQGISFLINIFFGVVYNAANSIAFTVSGLVNTLSHNILNAFRPQVIKNYSQGNISEVTYLINSATKFSSLIFSALSVPMILEMNQLLNIWLVSPPPLAGILCKLLLICGCIDIYGSSIYMGFMATGNIKNITRWSCFCYISVIPIAYLYYKSSAPLHVAFIIMIIIQIINLMGRVFLLKKEICQFAIRKYLTSTWLLGICAFISTYYICSYIINMMPETISRLFFVSLVSCLCHFLMFYIWNIRFKFIKRT